MWSGCNLCNINLLHHAAEYLVILYFCCIWLELEGLYIVHQILSSVNSRSAVIVSVVYILYTRYWWCGLGSLYKGTIAALSCRSLVVDEERISPDHRVGSMLPVSFSVDNSISGWKKVHLVDKKTCDNKQWTKTEWKQTQV